ncbi:hypothetical protein E3E31_05110 [Thermococcus sp. M39]|uniref:hypothetical protein n=1 Tax=unclassified Thermococcus TaxID=2627626 RepID=UPI00143AFC41|nr:MULTISPECIES: hypothetical protein [unclassified Thermococcus]NJE07904.1 hypothetical protein [Thermococcus sp. M39]NJE13386.1 hypothetical protein [Thermococcus sp. LS2]
MKEVVLILLLLFLALPLASALQDSSLNPWGISLQPFVIYSDSEGALVGVDYGYYEEAGHFSEGVLKPMELWTYFIFYVNKSGVYYVDFMGFSGYELPPLAFYKGWLYLFLLTSTNTSFPMKNPPASDRVTVIRYREGVLQKLGEVLWIGEINVSMLYLLLYEWPKGKRVLYKIDDSVELIAIGNERNLTLKSEPYESWLRKLPFDPGNLQNKQCLRPVVKGSYVLFEPSHFRVPLRELKQRFEPVNRSCAIFFGDGLLIVPPSLGVGFANESMWVQSGYNYHGLYTIILYPGQGRPQKPLKVSLYYYDGRTLKELPLLQVSEEGVRVLALPVKYSELTPKKWYQSQLPDVLVLFLAVLTLMIVFSRLRH